MKSTFINKVIAGCLTGMIVLSMAACGAADGQAGLSTKKENTLSQCFSTDMDIVWYEVTGDFGKDADVKAIYAFKDGKLTVYNQYAIGKSLDKLGVYAQLSDEEVVESLEAARQERIQYMQYGEELLRAREEADKIPQSYMVFGYEIMPQLLGTYLQMSIEDWLAYIDQKASSEEVVVPGEDTVVSYTVVTDGTGNAVQAEQLAISQSYLRESNFQEYEHVNIPLYIPACTETEAEEMLKYDSYYLLEGYSEYVSYNGATTIHDYLNTLYGDEAANYIADTLVFLGNEYRYEIREELGKELFEYAEIKLFKPEISENTLSLNSIYPWNYGTSMVSGSENPGSPVFSSFFDGYYIVNSSNSPGWLCTKVHEAVTFALDEIGTEGVEVK